MNVSIDCKASNPTHRTLSGDDEMRLPKEFKLPSNYARLPLLVGGAVILIVLAGLFAQIARGDNSQPPLLTNNPLSPEAFATNVAHTEALDRADQQRMEDARNGRFGVPPTKNPFYSPPAAPTQVAFWQGTIQPADNHASGKAGDGQYHWINGWTGIINHRQLGVVAGSLVDRSGSGTPELGILRVDGVDLSLNGLYKPPAQSGPLRITAVNGSCLTIASTGNTTYQFDAVAHTWSCSSSTAATP